VRFRRRARPSHEAGPSGGADRRPGYLQGRRTRRPMRGRPHELQRPRPHSTKDRSVAPALVGAPHIHRQGRRGQRAATLAPERQARLGGGRLALRDQRGRPGGRRARVQRAQFFGVRARRGAAPRPLLLNRACSAPAPRAVSARPTPQRALCRQPRAAVCRDPHCTGPATGTPTPRFSREGIGLGCAPATRSISSSAARRRSSAVAAACRAAAASPRAAAAPASAASPRRRQAAPSAAAPRAAAASRSAAASEVRSASPSAAADLSTASCAARRRQRMRGAALLSACAGARCAPLAGPCCNLWQHTLMFGTPSAGRRWCRTGAPAPALAGARGTQLQAAAQHVRHISATASEGIAWHAGRGPARVRCSASHRSACPAKA